MKIIREYINEKFKQESDPISDLGIGGVNFYDEYMERYALEEHKLFKEWQNFVMQFKGKWFFGKMDKYPKGKYSSERVESKVLAHEIEIDKLGLVNIKTDFATYHLLPTERYIITDK
jgi:hypothetical protein